MTVRFHGTSLSGSLNVNSTNRMVVQRKDDVSFPNVIRMVVTGNGCLMLQVCADNLWLFLMVNIHAVLFNQQREDQLFRKNHLQKVIALDQKISLKTQSE